MSLKLTLQTELCELLGISIPIVAAPMAGASGGLLAAHVSLGGGFGLMAAGYDSLSTFQHQLSIAREALDHPRLEEKPLPIGVGFLCWQLELPNSPAVQLLTAALEHNVRAIWFSFGSNLAHWVKVVKDYDVEHGRSTIVFAQISSVQEAVQAIDEWQVDVVVAQGIESGGHGSSKAPPVAILATDIVAATKKNRRPILAAGGISNGIEIANFIKLGTAGVVLGTRFLLTPQSLYTSSQKEAMVVVTDASATVRTGAFDAARGTLGWPKDIDGRALRNKTVEEFDKAGITDNLIADFSKAVKEGDAERMLMWAGTGVHKMNSIKDVKEILDELRKEAEEALLGLA